MLEQYLADLFTEHKEMKKGISLFLFLFRCPEVVPRGTGPRGWRGESEPFATSLVQAFYVDSAFQLI